MTLRQVQIDSSDLEIAVAEQDLDGAQIGAGFKQVCRETMAQSVRMDVPVLKAGPFRGNLAGSPEDLGGDRVTCRVPAVTGKEPLLGLAPEAAPISSQRFEQLRTEHDVAVLGALAVADLQVGRFGAACAGGIERHEQDAMKRRVGPADQAVA